MNTNALSSHTFHTCHIALSFHTSFVQADINTYWFCICTHDTGFMYWRGQWEKSPFNGIPLLFTNSTQFKGDAALGTVLCKRPIWKPEVSVALVFHTKVTLSPSTIPQTTVALLSCVILSLLINGERSANDDAWTFYLKDLFFLALWAWKKSHRALRQMKSASEFINSVKKTAVSRIYIYIHKMKLCVKGQGEDMPHGSRRELKPGVLNWLKG